MRYLKVTLPLLAVYLLLTANLQASNILLGLLIAAGAATLVRPDSPPYDIRRLPGAAWALIRYLVILAADIIKSGLIVARIVLTPSLPIKPGIIAIPSHCKSDLAVALSAHAVTVTPGELVVEIGDDGVLYTHTLDASKADEYRAEAQQLRQDLLCKIFT